MSAHAGRSGDGLAAIPAVVLLCLPMSIAVAQESDSGAALDVLQRDVVDQTDAFCQRLETASSDDVNALKAEYADFAREEEASLDRIAQEEAALEARRRALDADSERFDDWDELPADDPRLAQAEATIIAARNEVSRLTVARRSLVEENANLIKRRNDFSAASERIRQADSDIAQLTELIRRVDAGELASEDNALGEFGDRRWSRHNRTALEQELERAQGIRSQALQVAGDALFLPSAPASIEELGGRVGALHGDWQALQSALQGLDGQIAQAEAAVQSALVAKQETHAAIRSERRDALIAAKAAHADAVTDYRARVEQLIVNRTVALLSYQIYAGATDCIRKAEARLKETASGQTAAAEIRFISATITETCYGSTSGPAKEITPSFTFEPAYWHLSLFLTPEQDIKIAAVAYLAVHDDDLPDPPGLGRARLQPDGSFSLKTQYPTPQNFYYIPPGEPADGTGVREPSPYPPFEVEGWLRPDPDAQHGFVGKGTGVVMHRRIENRWGVHFHHGEPCRIAWTVP